MPGVERFDQPAQGLPKGVRPVIGQSQEIGIEPHTPLIGAGTSNERPERPRTPVQWPVDRPVVGAPIADVHRFTVADRPTAPAPPTTRIAKPFPTDPHEQRGNILLSTNLGPKSLTIQLLPPDGSMITKSDLAQTYKRTFEGASFILPKGLPRQGEVYCETALVPHGLVAQEFTVVSGATQRVIGYGLTDAGQELGVPASAIAINYELSTEQSLYPLMGPINSPNPDGARAPIQRATMLELLADTSEPMRFKTVRDRTGIEHRSVEASIQALEMQGLVKYDADSGRIGKKARIYTLGERPLTDVPAYTGNRTFSNHLVDALTALDELGEEITQNAVFEALPQKVRDRRTEYAVRQDIGRHVKHFVKEGALSNNNRSGFADSSLTITDAGKQFVDGYVRKIDLLIAGDAKTHTEAAAISRKIHRDPVPYARRADQIYYPHSRTRQLELREERLHTLTDAIGTHGDGVAVTSLVGILDMKPGTIKEYVRILEKRGIVDVQIVRGARVARLREALQN